MTTADLIYLSIGCVLFTVFAGLAVRLLAVAREARWAYRDRVERGEPDVEGLSEAAFARAYRRAYGPRGQLYAVAAVSVAVVTSPLSLMALRAVAVGLNRLAGGPQWFMENDLLWQFFLYFGLIFTWVGIAAVAVRLYYRKPVRDFDAELERERALIGP